MYFVVITNILILSLKSESPAFSTMGIRDSNSFFDMLPLKKA